jgi:hypothetical protein
MKNILYFALAGTLMLGSCQKDFLERAPQNSVPETLFWKTENDVYLAVNALYAELPGEGLMYEDGAADIAHAQYPWESTSTVISSGIVPTTTNAGWNFVGIRKANYFLANVDKAALDEGLKNRYKAEVRFVRALKYVGLVNKFGDVPLITKELSLPESNVPRNAKAEVVQFILDELTEIATILPTSYTSGRSNEIGRITKGAALAIKARVELQESKWAEAANTAREIMTLGYELFNVNAEIDALDLKDDYSKFVDFADAEDEKKFRLGLRSYESLFHEANEGNKEVILDRQYIEQLQPQYTNTYLPEGGIGGWSSLTPTQNLVNAYQSYKTGESVAVPTNAQRADRYKNDLNAFLEEYKNRDPRFYATILFETAPWSAVDDKAPYTFKWVAGGNNMSKTGYNFRKLVDPKAIRDRIANHANFIIIRYAEVLLTFAEAQNELSGPSAEVYAALDQIRQRAGMPKVDQAKYASKESLRQLIRNERLVELALEGHRYVDIRRWGIAPQVMNTIYDLNNSVAQARVWEDKLWLMPIPQKEIDNAHGVLVQNDGY